MNLMDNLNNYLYILFGAFTVVEILIRVLFPLFKKNPWMETVDSLWVAMAVALSLKAVLIQPFTIPSGSMEDTLLVGDYILVKKYEYGYSLFNKTDRFLEFKKPQRRDVVVFQFPQDPSKDFIKRCIGIPGDVIELKNQDLYVNGEKQIEPYVKHIMPANLAIEEEGPDTLKVNFGPVTIQPGHYFMMGDNRDNSLDSRYWGQLDEKLIKGRAWLIYWHSVGFPVFFSLCGMVTALISAFYWVVFTRRRSAKAAQGLPVDGEKDAIRSARSTLIIALVVAGFMLGMAGIPTFKEKCGELKQRMFMVIR